MTNSIFIKTMILKSKKKIISLVDNDTIIFIDANTKGGGDAGEKIPLDEFINRPDDVPSFSLPMGNCLNSLLIVPDYWFGNFTHKFQSTKKSLSNSFVERKLRDEFTNQPEIKNFSDCIFYQRELKEQWLYAYYLQKPIFFQLYEKLCSLNLPPHRITSPAFIWKHRLQDEVPNFKEGGKCLIHLLPEICFLYFFFEGNFTFSRTITLANLKIDSSETNFDSSEMNLKMDSSETNFDSSEMNLKMDSSENFEAVNYELNQSLYLFSQQTKTEIEEFFIISSGMETPKDLSGILGKDLQDLNYLKDRLKDRFFRVDNLSEPTRDLITSDLLSQKDFLSLTHRKLKNELDWKPIQRAGIFMGLLLLLFFSLESVFLYRLHNKIQFLNRNAVHSTTAIDHQKIEQYNEALNVLLNVAEEPSLSDSLVKIAKSLPHHIYLQEFILDTDLNRGMHIKCFMKSLGADHLKESLASLISKLNENLKLNQAIRLQDVDFEFDKMNQRYLIEFSLEL